MHKTNFVRLFKNFVVKVQICSGAEMTRDKMKILRKSIAVLDNDKPSWRNLFSPLKCKSQSKMINNYLQNFFKH
jgi:hypothetical protein